MDRKGAFHQGYINYSPEGGFQFIFIRSTRSRKVDFTVPLPNFKHHWTKLMGYDRLFPGHSTVRSFLNHQHLAKMHPHSTISLLNILSPHVHHLSVKPLTPPTLPVKSESNRTKRRNNVSSNMMCTRRSPRANIFL